eukprot:m.119932 g.119932  ORF g.119932 m.119932 type:complete len:4300 (+) comp11038_c0_seq7:960-13859(+)
MIRGWSLVVLGVVLISASARGAVIHSVSPSNGSIAGGTLVTIQGSGFQRGGIVGGTNVFIGHLECEVISYWSSDERLVCTAAELHNFSIGSSEYPVRVAMHSMTSASFARGSFEFQYWDDATPFIRRSSAGVLAGGELKFGGLLRAATTDDLSVTIDGVGCPIVNPYLLVDEFGTDVTEEAVRRRNRRQASDPAFVDTLPDDSVDTFSSTAGSVDVEARVVAEDDDDDVTERCTLPAQLEAGRYNYTVSVAPSRGRGYGHAKFFERSVQTHGSRDIVSVTDSGLHVVTVYPVVSSLSTSVSGTHGGHRVTLAGSGFATNCSANVVTLSGAPCEVVSCSTSELVCIASNSTHAVTSGPFEGTAGLTERFWDTRASTFDFATSIATFATPDAEAVSVNGAVTSSLASGQYWSTEQAGVFVAPFNASYRFWVMGDDHAQVELNPNGDSPAGLQVVASLSGQSATSGSYYTSSYATRPSQKSAPIALTAGERYAFRARHVQSAGAGYYQAAVEILNAPSTAVHPQYHRVNERQEIIMSSTRIRQVQRITLHNTTGGVLEFLGGSGGPHNATISSSGSFTTSVSTPLRAVVSGCNTFGLTVDNSQFVATGTLVIDIEYRCSPMMINSGTTVSPWPLLRVSTADLNRLTASTPVSAFVTNLQNPSDPITGSYTLSLAGVTHSGATVSHSNSRWTLANRVKTALRGFPGVQDVVVTVEGDARYTPRFTVDFLVPQGFNFPPIDFDLSTARGTNLTVSTSTVQNGAPGSILYDPIPASLFEVHTGSGAATVIANGIRAACADADASACAFAYDAAVTPVVTSTSSSGGATVMVGDVLTITGTGLQHNGGSVAVSFGGSSCSVITHSTTQITCTVGHATRGTYVPEVIVDGTGMATTTGVAPLEYGFALNSVSPVHMSYRGGTLVTLTGTGFARRGAAVDNTILVDGAACEEVSARPDQVVCVTPEAAAIANLSGTPFASLPATTSALLTVGLFDNASATVTYATAHTPSITMVTPTEISAAITTTVTMSGSFLANGFFLSGVGCEARMDFVAPSGAVRTCSQLTLNSTAATCVLVRGPAFAVDEQALTVPRLQLCTTLPGDLVAAVVAHPEPAFRTVDLALRVASVSPQVGSIAGGTLVTVRGAGFADESARIVRSALTYNYLTPMVVVNLTLYDRNVPCLLESSNFTTIECTTVFPTSSDATLTQSAPAVYPSGSYNAEVAVSVNDFPAPGCVNNSGAGAAVSLNASTPTVYVADSGSWCASVAPGSFCVSWGPAPSADAIQFTLTGATSGWLAVGIADNAGSMGPADVMMCWVRNGVATATDRFNPQRGVNVLDVSQDITLVSGSESNGITTCTFTRPLAASDSNDREVPAGAANLLWAMGPLDASEDTPRWHGSTNRGGMSATLLTAVTDNDSGSGSSADGDAGTYTPGGDSDEYVATIVSFVDALATSCSFNYDMASTPTLTQASPAAGAGETVVILSGTGFTTEPTVLVGETSATVTAFTATSITVTVPAMQVGVYFVRVHVPGTGLAAHPEAAPVTFSSQLQLTSVQPTVSSTAGGLVITYSGAGFSLEESDNELVIGGVRAHVIDAQHDRLVAVSPAMPAVTTTVATVEVTVPADELPSYHFGQTNPTSVRYEPVSGPAFSGGIMTLPTVYNTTDVDAITYDPTATPTVVSVSPTSGSAGDSITVEGTDLVGNNITEVLIGAEPCAVTSLNATHAVCTLGATPAGSHLVFVTVHGKGTARGAVTFTASLSISALSVTSGSFGGGTTLVVTGSGFGGGAASTRRARRQMDGAWGGWIIYDREAEAEAAEEFGTQVSLCGRSCTVNGSTYTSVVCDTPQLDSPESIAAFNAQEVELLNTDSYITETSAQSTADLAFDYDFATSFTAASWVGLDLGNETRAVISKMRFFPAHQQAERFIGCTFESSVDGIVWTQLAEGTPVTPHQGWNWAVFDVPTQTPARYIRMVSQSPQMHLAMLEIFGYAVSVTSVCPVTVVTTTPLSHPSLGLMTTSHTPLTSLAGPIFTYQVSSTPVITAVNPKYGSSLGGDRITITGSNLATTVANAQVSFSGVDCSVVAASPTGDSIECITGRRGPIARHNSVPLTLVHRDLAPGRGYAVSNSSVQFRFLDKWSAVNTWLNDEPPIDGDSVVIPIDQTILLDVQPPRLFLLLVQGALVWDRIDVNLDASYILVQGGLLEIGTEEDPFLNTTTITLHGDRRKSVEVPHIGAKVLAVADRGGFTSFGNGSGAEVPDSQRGVLDIHGAPRLRTWTKVAVGTYPAGTTRIVTSEPTDFAPGEKVVITAPHQLMTVAARIDAYTFDTVEPMQRAHVSEWYNHTGDGGTFELDMRFEVALISRNVVIQGAGGPRADGTPTLSDADDETSSESQRFGVHTGAFHGGFYRMENAEFRHCGQAGVLGRYCMHFHQAGDAPAPNNYIKSNSIHDSFQRATTIHGTHHSLVQNNVAYKVAGHTYFVEDGDETYNTFDNNIGIATLPLHMMLKSDVSPATFWTATPTNLWRNNVATDSSARGAWYELTNQGITLEFRNNSFHHNSGIGFRNYPNYSPPAPQWFHNNSYFRNGGNGLFYKQGGDNHHVYSKFAENGVDIFWKKYKINQAAVERNIPNVQDCVFWGGRGAQAIFAPQHEFWSVNGSTFINYDDNQARGVLSGCAGCCSANSMRQGAYTFRFQRLHWINSTLRTQWTCPYKQIMYDLDGTLTGSVGGTALPFYKFNEWADGCFNDTSGVYTSGGWAAGGMVCNGSTRVRRLQLEGQEPEELDRKAISFKKSEVVNGVEQWGGLNWTRYIETGVLYDGTCHQGNYAPGWRPADFSGCDVMDSLDWINYRTCNSDFSGWAVPMVTQHDYWADIDWHVDFQRLKMRWSEPFYLTNTDNVPLVGEESVMLKWPYVDYRFRFRTEWDGTFRNGDSLPWFDRSTAQTTLNRSDPFGTSLILREDDSLRTTGSRGEWHLSVNPWSGVNLTSTYNPMKLRVQALQCGPNMCGLPGDIPETWPAPRYWSDPETWLEIQRRANELNTISVTPTGQLPVEGEHVEIPQGMYVILDVNPPRLGKLVVVGRLQFGGDNTQAATSSTVRVLRADRILVWGLFEIGDAPNAPFPGTAEVILDGIRTSPTLVATDQHYLGNKNLVVFGYARLFGTERPSTWTTLDATVDVGARSITLTEDPVGWQVGDSFMLAPTEYPQPIAIEQEAPGFNMSDYAATQMEERQITAIAGRTLHFNVPLSYRHFAGVVDSGAGYSVELRAHVGLLTSNVVVRGDITATPVEGQANWYSGYGGHIVVGEVNYGSEEEIREARRNGEQLGTVQKLGSLIAESIEFRDMGKLASEHGAINYRYFSDLRQSQYPSNTISKCSFRSTWNHAVVTTKSFGLEVVGNAIQNTFYSGIQIDEDSRATRIDDNLLVANQRSPDEYTPRCILDQSCWVHPFAAFRIESKFVASVQGNVAAGAEDTGFMLYPVDDCGTPANLCKIRNNEAYGALVGLFMLDVRATTSAGQRACKAMDGFKAWKNAHIGVLTVDQSVNMELTNVHVADNHEGISMNYVKSGGVDHYTKLSHSSVLGSTAASTCSESIDCRAVAPNDLRGLSCGSEFGTSWRRVGIVMPQYTNLPKTCGRGGISPCRPVNVVNRPCSLPWENRFGNVDVQHATFNISHTAFRYWSTSDCGRTSRAIQINPSQPDFTPVVYASDLTWNDYDATSRFILSDVSHQTHEATACRTSSCDAVNYFTIEDLDGSTHGAFWDDGTPPGPVTLLSAHNAPASDSQRCRTDSNTGTFVCRDAPVARVILESNPPRFTSRRLGPVTIRRYGAAASDERVFWSTGPFPQGCSCQKHFAQFTFQAMANHTYDINSTGVLEDRNRISFPHPDPNFCVLVKILFSRPNPVRVTVGAPDGPEVPRIMTGIRPTVDDTNPSGANLMDPQARQLFMKLCGGTSQQWWLVYENRVMVSAILSMTTDEFFGATQSNQRDATETFVTNIAMLLGINPSQIRVTCVHPVDDPVCLGPSRRSRRSTTRGLVVDMLISPRYVIQDVSTTTEIGPNGTEINATYVTNETVSDEDRTAELEAIFAFFQDNQTQLISGLATLPGNFTVESFAVEWEQATADTTTPIATTVAAASGDSGLDVPMPILIPVIVVAILVVAAAGVLYRRQQRAAGTEAKVKATEGNLTFTDHSGAPSYFARNRAELVQDSLIIRTPKQAYEPEKRYNPSPDTIAADTVSDQSQSSPQLEGIRVDDDNSIITPPAARTNITEVDTWQPVAMVANGRFSFVSGSVTTNPAVAISTPNATSGYDLQASDEA